MDYSNFEPIGHSPEPKKKGIGFMTVLALISGAFFVGMFKGKEIVAFVKGLISPKTATEPEDNKKVIPLNSLKPKKEILEDDKDEDEQPHDFWGNSPICITDNDEDESLLEVLVDEVIEEVQEAKEVIEEVVKPLKSKK